MRWVIKFEGAERSNVSMAVRLRALNSELRSRKVDAGKGQKSSCGVLCKRLQHIGMAMFLVGAMILDVNAFADLEVSSRAGDSNAIESNAQASKAEPGLAVKPRLLKGYGKLPMSFEVNEGQVDSQVKFLSWGNRLHKIEHLSSSLVTHKGGGKGGLQ